MSNTTWVDCTRQIEEGDTGDAEDILAPAMTYIYVPGNDTTVAWDAMESCCDMPVGMVDKCTVWCQVPADTDTNDFSKCLENHDYKTAGIDLHVGEGSAGSALTPPTGLLSPSTAALAVVLGFMFMGR